MRAMRIAKATFVALLFLSVLCSERSYAEFFLQAELGATQVDGGVLWWDGDIGFGDTAGDTSGNEVLLGIGARYRLGDRIDVGIRVARYRLDDLALRYGSATLRLYF